MARKILMLNFDGALAMKAALNLMGHDLQIREGFTAIDIDSWYLEDGFACITLPENIKVVIRYSGIAAACEVPDER